MQLNNLKKQKNKGFTLIELVVSSSILAIIFGGMTTFGVNTIKSYQRTQALKNTVEDARYAIEILNKTIRTSHTIDSENPNEIFIIDNVNKSNHCYRFYDNKLQRKIDTTPNAEECADMLGGSFSDIIGNDEVIVSGNFKVKATDKDNSIKADRERGFVRTQVKLKYTASGQDNFDEDEMIIQSSVSLRDYGFDD